MEKICLCSKFWVVCFFLGESERDGVIWRLIGRSDLLWSESGLFVVI